MPRRIFSPLLKGLLLSGPVLGLVLAGSPVASAGVTWAHAPRLAAENGYVDTNSAGNTYQETSANWTQPAITCGASATSDAFWVGIDGYTSPTVEQAGTAATCQSGKATYYSWWEMYPGATQVVGTTVKSGDKITASVTKSGSSKYTLAVTDATHTADSFTVTENCAPTACVDSSAEWIEQPSGSPVVAAWKVKGATVKSGSVTGVISTFPYVVLGTAGPLNAAGNGFTVP
jgi:Peptidase A4 family